MNFPAGTPVRSVDNPGREGVVTNQPPRKKPSGIYLPVRWNDGSVDFLHEEEIEALANLDLQDPFALASEGRYGRVADLRRNLTYVHLSGKLANLVYAMGITNTEFYAYQYRPLLTLLESPVNGILIADEVGLGKTIEAGLIWTELRARFDMRRLLVVCPAMLREKWRDELRSRFGVDARIIGAEELLDQISQTRWDSGDGQAWIISYQAARPPRAWRVGREPSDSGRGSARGRLAEFLDQRAGEEKVFDLVIFDEAHYMRNRETTAWSFGELARDASDYQVMLSATPINLRNQDLFNLLTILDPDHFQSEQDFGLLLGANRPLIEARDRVLSQASTATEILDLLQAAAENPYLKKSTQLGNLISNPPTDTFLRGKGNRAQLAERLERLNLLSHVLTRTRKRDVQKNRITRDVSLFPVEFGEQEALLYQAVTWATIEFAKDRDISDGFLLATPQRQVASCPAAMAEAWLGHREQRKEFEEDLGAVLASELEAVGEDGEKTPLRDLLSSVIPNVIDIEALREEDSKFKELRRVLAQWFRTYPQEKIVVFTTFRATARYLTDRFSEEGMPALLVKGGMDRPKQELIDDFRADKNIRILVSTEVAAEGVDLQFCKVLINYDLPWNPTRVEQRIGRIDRLGQKSEIIHIWNLHFKGTIDEKIVQRLFNRLRIFEEALGETEAVVGRVIGNLEAELLSRQLSPEEIEAKIDEAAQAIENEKRHHNDLEQNAAHMMAHGQRVLERIEAAKELSKRVTEADLYVYLKDYLETYWPGHRFSQESKDPHLVSIQMPGELAARFEEFLRVEKMQGASKLCSGQAIRCRFLNRISEQTKGREEIIHQFHPFVRFVGKDLKARNEHFYPLIALQLATDAAATICGTGTYSFFVRSWTFLGVQDEEYLAIAAVRLEDSEALSADESEQLLQLGRMRGVDWVGAHQELDSNQVQVCMEHAETLLDDRYRLALEKKRDENSDRAKFQLDSIERHLERRLPTLRETMQAHIAKGRPSLAKATQGKMDKLNARMNARREVILEREKVHVDKQFVCAGVIRVG